MSRLSTLISSSKSHSRAGTPTKSAITPIRPRRLPEFALSVSTITWALKAIIGYVILPNLAVGMLVYLIAGSWHPINLDYLLLGVAVGVIGQATLVVGFAALFLLDLALAFAPLFHFDGATFSHGLLQLLLARPWLTVTLALPATGVALAFGTVSFRLVTVRGRTPLSGRVLLLAFGATLVIADALNGTNQFVHLERTRVSLNLAGSGIYHTGVDIRDARHEAAQRVKHGLLRPAHGATEALLNDINASEPRLSEIRNVSLVLVESMGMFRDPHIDSVLLAPLLGRDVASRYEVRIGSAAFNGPTTAGEFRELCGVQGTYLVAPQTPLGRCIPELLRAQGFRTIAVHGFRSNFFNRDKWYPVVGFEQLLFERQAADSGAALCGAIFRGPCDADVARLYARKLIEGPPNERRFVYWVTLSSHFPVDRHAVQPAAFDCKQLPAIIRDASVCDLMRLWSTVLLSVRNTALESRLRPTRFVIVGDHSPPFLDEERRKLFSDTAVPFVELIPRSAVLHKHARNSGAID